MNFVTGFSWTSQGFDVVSVAVDRLTKFALFLLIRINYLMDKLAQVYLQKIIRLHGVQKLLYRIKTLDLYRDLGRVYLKQWVLNYNQAQWHTFRQTNNRRGPFNIGRYVKNMCIGFQGKLG